MNEAAATTDEPVMTFGSALAAALWAYEKCSMMGGYARPGIRPPSRRTGNHAPWYEVQDLALTITQRLANVEPPIAARVLQVLLEPPELADDGRWREVVRAVSDYAHANAGVTPPAAPFLRAMANVAVLRVRCMTHYPRNAVRPPAGTYATVLGVGRSTIDDKGWLALRKSLEGAASGWRDIALAALGQELEAIGVVRRRSTARE